MIRWNFALVVLLFSTFTAVCAQEVVRTEPQPELGFHWPYYSYVPQHRAPGPLTILVLPNNSGKSTDDFQVQDDSALRRTEWGAEKIAEVLGVALLRPVFPRTRSQWYCYTHALDRDTLLTRRPGVERLDLQLLAMVEHFRRAQAEPVRPKFLMAGFSASAMFCNRFALLHPEHVLGAAVGSPGGWPIAPQANYKDKRLRYPVGVGDMEDVSGRPFQLELFQQVPMFFFLGDQDENDSVPYSDGFDPQDRDLVMELFGKTPVQRWALAQNLYRQAGAPATFHLYPGGEHFINKAMRRDMLAFFSDLLTPDRTDPI